MAKKLSADSVLNPADLDGDGEITNSELDRHERMIRIENNDKLQDQRVDMLGQRHRQRNQHRISGFSAHRRCQSAYGDGFAFNLRCSQHGIVAAFMGATAFTRVKENGA